MTLIERVATAMETCDHPFSSEHVAQAAIREVLRAMTDWEHDLAGPSETAAEAFARAHNIDMEGKE